MKSKILSIILLIFFTTIIYGQPASKQDPKLLKEIVKQNKTKIAANQQKIHEKKQQAKMVINQISTIEKKIYITKNKLEQSHKMLNWYQNQVKQKETALSISRKKFNEKKNLLKKRIVQIYKNKNLGFLEFLFSSKDFSSIMDNSFYFERILKTDVNLVKEINQICYEISNKKKELANKKEQVHKYAVDISQQKSVLAGEKNEKRRYLLSIKEEIARYERENRILQQDSRRMELLIQRSMQKNRVFLGTGRFIAPVSGWVSSPYGWRTHPIFKRRIFHTGIDIASGYGVPIRAADSGEVIFRGWWGGYGNAIIIDHGTSISTVYAHLSRIVVNKNIKVSKGTIIGYVGSTGFSTGPHLHFEVRVKGKPVNPRLYINI